MGSILITIGSDAFFLSSAIFVVVQPIVSVCALASVFDFFGAHRKWSFFLPARNIWAFNSELFVMLLWLREIQQAKTININNGSLQIFCLRSRWVFELHTHTHAYDKCIITNWILHSRNETRFRLIYDFRFFVSTATQRQRRWFAEIKHLKWCIFPGNCCVCVCVCVFLHGTCNFPMKNDNVYTQRAQSSLMSGDTHNAQRQYLHSITIIANEQQSSQQQNPLVFPPQSLLAGFVFFFSKITP